MADHFIGAVKEHMERLKNTKDSGGQNVVVAPPPAPPKQTERQILAVATRANGLYPWTGKATGV